MKKKHLQNLCILIFTVSCTRIEIKNTEACAVAGRLGAGANCSDTLSNNTREMTFNEFATWLEPDPKTGRGAAVCQSAADWNSQKIALEQACAALKDACSFEMRMKIKQATSTIDKLVDKAEIQSKKLEVKR